jgi:hypothetical protein
MLVKVPTTFLGQNAGTVCRLVVKGYELLVFLVQFLYVGT